MNIIMSHLFTFEIIYEYLKFIIFSTQISLVLKWSISQEAPVYKFVELLLGSGYG